MHHHLGKVLVKSFPQFPLVLTPGLRAQYEHTCVLGLHTVSQEILRRANKESASQHQQGRPDCIP